MDDQLTADIQAWVQSPTGERDVAAGAALLLKLNRNQWLFRSACKFPDRYESTIAYELGKHLRIRLDGLTQREVALMDRTVKQEAAALLAVPTALHSGRRADHDSLPQDVQDLFDRNGGVYFRIKQIYNTLLQMEGAMPCDRYEYLVQLRELDTQYYANLEAYDSYDGTSAADVGTIVSESDAATAAADPMAANRQISAARKFVSENLAKAEQTEDDTVRREIAEAVQSRVDFILEMGGTFKVKMRERLELIGIHFPDN